MGTNESFFSTNTSNRIHRSTELPKYVSASRLKLWLRCPLAYKLRYIDGVVTPTTPSLFFGTIVHRVLEYFFRYRQRGVTLFPEVVADRLKKDWDSALEEEFVAFSSINEERQLQAKAVELVTAYLTQISGDESLPIAVEKRFEAPLIDPATGEDLGIPLVGIIDLVLATENGAVIRDFKTAARSSAQRDVLHELQLSCYSYLFRCVTGQIESGLEIHSLIKTKTPKVEVTRYDPRKETYFARLFSVIRAYLDAVGSNQYHIRPGLGCSFCDYQQLVCRN